MIHALWDRLGTLAGHRQAIWVLAAAAFLDGWVLPFPPEVLLVPMVLAVPGRAILLTAGCVVASTMGAVAGYWIGAQLYEELGKALLAVFGRLDELDRFATLYADWGVWAVFVTGITPFPDKVAAILSGASGLSFPAYVAIGLLTRILRFGLVAGLLWRFGSPFRDFIRRRLGLVFR